MIIPAILIAGLGLFIVFVSLGVGAAIQRASSVQKAHEEYKRTLQALARYPDEPRLVNEARSLGERYARLRRGDQGVTASDEASIQQDIDDAVANVGATQSSVPKFQTHLSQKVKTSAAKPLALLLIIPFAYVVFTLVVAARNDKQKIQQEKEDSNVQTQIQQAGTVDENQPSPIDSNN